MKKKGNQQAKEQNIIASINQNLYSLANHLGVYVSVLRNTSSLKNAPVAD